jgi:putative endonuclease|tara:strand:+ start:3178 stop:3558 length:381 start_codon:yes stop_codon:yes gene_type:complete
VKHPIPPTSRRAAGTEFESLAIDYLCRNGLTLITRNYHCRYGEIDLIMNDKKTLVFVEVRFRSDAGFVSPQESITPVKMKRIVRTARHYLHRYKLTEKVSSRIDFIGIDGGCQPERINWVRNAISA